MDSTAATNWGAILMGQLDIFESVIIFLCAGVVMVPIAQKIRLGAVLGYLLAGIVMGHLYLALSITLTIFSISQKWVLSF